MLEFGKDKGPVRGNLYAFPEIYDIAFFWDISQEIAFFITLFKKHVPFKVKHIVEPACGTGRFLRSFPQYGYCITGYDSNLTMAAYARKKIAEAELQDMAMVLVSDMKSARFQRPFDAAFNSINSIGYLLSDKDVISHFANTGDSLKKNGIYIVHLNCAHDTDSYDRNEWGMERDGIRVKTTWRIKKEDRQQKLCHQIGSMQINDHDKEILLEDHHTLRLWFFEDLKNLTRRSGRFKLEAIYDENHTQISSDSHISGELGNLYFVLKVL